jgi:bifunctional ADP-heptose synthase (sugar kinase/adenylyltransferase)
VKLDFSGLRILVIGDPIADVYHWGHVDRVSPEAPVPVFIEDSVECREGGAWNVAKQMQALGVSVGAYWREDDRSTEKHRYMVGNHQLMRLDRDRCVRTTLSFDTALDFDAIVISDYAKGHCTPELCQHAIKSGIPTIVDPKGKDWEKYRGCAVICPNHLEINGNDGFNIIEKRGAEGLRYNGIDYPSTARRVYDVTGCGDTVTAVVAACIAKGMDIPSACVIANQAAGYVAGEIGTTVCSIEKLRELCE